MNYSMEELICRIFTLGVKEKNYLHASRIYVTQFLGR